jgi:hypothetical protein
MNYKFEHAPTFDKELKRLAKKYKSLKKDVKNLEEEIKNNPLLGTNLGGGIKKIRLNIKAKNQGKSGGARVITHELIFNVNTEKEEKNILFVAIYDKSEYDTVDLSIIKEIIEFFREEDDDEKE